LLNFTFNIRFQYKIEGEIEEIEEEKRMDNSSTPQKRTRKYSVYGSVSKGQNTDLYSFPIVRSKKHLKANLSIKLKGYGWSEPISIVMPSVQDEVNFKGGYLVFPVFNILYQYFFIEYIYIF
jgi:hypothetical protein